MKMNVKKNFLTTFRWIQVKFTWCLVHTASSGSNVHLTLINKASYAVMSLFSDAFGITLCQRFLTTLFACCNWVQTSYIFTHLELPFYLNLFLGQKRGQSNKINSWSVRKVQSTTTREWKTYYWTWKNFRSNKCSSTSSISQRWFCSHWKTPSWKWAIDCRTRENAKISQYWLVY